MIKSNTSVIKENLHGVIAISNLYDGIFLKKDMDEIRREAIKEVISTFYPKTLVKKIKSVIVRKRWERVFLVWSALILCGLIEEVKGSHSRGRRAKAYICFDPSTTCALSLYKHSISIYQIKTLMMIFRDRQTIHILIIRNLPKLRKLFQKVYRTNFLFKYASRHQVRGDESIDYYQTVIYKIWEGTKSWNFRKYESLLIHIRFLMKADMHRSFQSRAGSSELDQSVFDQNSNEGDAVFIDRQINQAMNPYEILLSKELVDLEIKKTEVLLIRKKSQKMERKLTSLKMYKEECF